jgi:hypothetical protein
VKLHAPSHMTPHRSGGRHDVMRSEYVGHRAHRALRLQRTLWPCRYLGPSWRTGCEAATIRAANGSAVRQWRCMDLALGEVEECRMEGKWWVDLTETADMRE